jgi:hypothetical protein
MPRPKRAPTEQEQKANLEENEFLDNNGYVRVRVKGAPGGNVMKHRLVMEQVLGRPLKSNEKIKRKNGDKLDNNPGNLYVVVNGAVDPHRVEAKLHTERRRLMKRVEEIDRELKLLTGEEKLDKPWEA